MPTPSFRVTDALYEKMKIASNSLDQSVSDFVRSSVERRVDELNTGVDPEVDRSTDVIHKELEQKNDQISELHQLLGMSQKHSEGLALQLSDTTRLLEDHRQRRGFWKRVFGKD